MKRRIIVTDLTRFSNDENLCTAGIDTETFECIRPMPYLKRARCKELKLLPGAILEGDFTATQCTRPHTEDMKHDNLVYHGPATSDQFHRALEKSKQEGVEQGFGVPIGIGQKHIPPDTPPQHSIVTISVEPGNIQIVRDQFDKSKIKLHLTDSAGNNFSFLAITDLG